MICKGILSFFDRILCSGNMVDNYPDFRTHVSMKYPKIKGRKIVHLSFRSENKGVPIIFTPYIENNGGFRIATENDDKIVLFALPENNKPLNRNTSKYFYDEYVKCMIPGKLCVKFGSYYLGNTDDENSFIYKKNCKPSLIRS